MYEDESGDMDVVADVVPEASSFAIFGLCVGLCELQMCLLLGLAFLWLSQILIIKVLFLQ